MGMETEQTVIETVCRTCGESFTTIEMEEHRKICNKEVEDNMIIPDEILAGQGTFNDLALSPMGEQILEQAGMEEDSVTAEQR